MVAHVRTGPRACRHKGSPMIASERFVFADLMVVPTRLK
jgi:hypothetical protein